MPDEIQGDAGDVAKDLLQAVGNAYANKVEVETTLLDANVIPFKKDEPGAKPSLANRILKPKVTVYDSTGKQVFTMAPYGEPKDSSGLTKAGAAVLGFGFLALVFGAGRLSK
jgi:hypothetical protein